MEKKLEIPENIHILEEMEVVDEMWENPPPDKRSKEYKEWKVEINRRIDQINSWRGERIINNVR